MKGSSDHLGTVDSSLKPAVNGADEGEASLMF